MTSFVNIPILVDTFITEKISILLPIYNGIEFIDESVGSIISQTYKHWELIIGINGHPPNSVIYKKAKEFEKISSNIKVYDYDTKGKAATLNRMLLDCSTNWVALIDVDDIWLPDKLEKQTFFMNKYDVIGTKCVYFGDIEGTIPLIPNEDFSDYDFKIANPLINSSSLIKKKICEKYKWSTTTPIEDYDFWLRIRYDNEKQNKFYNLPDVFVKHRIHKSSAFNNTNNDFVNTILQEYISFPDIYYINLDNREDRKTHITKELRYINYPENKIIRVSAIKKDFGGLGCSMSHIKTLEQFLESGKDRCIILEDDFTFYDNIQNHFYKIFVKEEGLPENWDLVMLSSNTINESPFSDKFKKCIEAQTTSGYMIHKKFAPILLQNFKESESNLSSGHSYETYALDQYWKRLQPNSNWFICQPKIGYQLESYSDIINCIVNYKV